MVEGTKVFSISQGKDGDHDIGEKDGQAAKGGILAEDLHQFQDHHDSDDDIKHRDEKEEKPPAGTADHFQLDDNVVIGNKGSPAGLAGFDEQAPGAIQIKNNQRRGKQEHDNAQVDGRTVKIEVEIHDAS